MNPFDDPTYKIKITFVDQDPCCDFCNRKKNIFTATVWWTQPEAKKHASHHTYMVICRRCAKTILNEIEDTIKRAWKIRNQKGE